MSRPARLTLSGMLNYVPDLFEDLQLPTPPLDAAAIGLQADQLRAAWTIDKDELVNYICLHTAGQSLCFPDGVWMKKAIKTWSTAHVHEWQRVFDTYFYKYNPLWNKDGTFTEGGTDTNHDIGGQNTTGNYKRYTHGYGDQHKVIDEEAWTHADLNQDSTGETHNVTNTLTTNRTRTEQGNIGVTMSQELIAKERELAKLSIDDMICDDFKREFIVMIW